MLRATEHAQVLVRNVLRQGDWAVDATVGNGHDTVFLAEVVGPAGRVFGFDVQDAAIASASVRVRDLPQVTLNHCGHELLAERLPAEAKGQLAAVMFNLGYLPGGARLVTTATETTRAALSQALDFLKPGGLVTLVLYPGHPEGSVEAGAVRDFANGLGPSFAVAHWARLNTVKPAPELLVIERNRD